MTTRGNEHPLRFHLLLIAIATAMIAPLHSAVAQSATATAASPETALDPYRIGPEDVIAITVWKNEPMSRTVQVRPDGMISLPLIDEVTAAGLTPVQLRDVLAKRLAEFIPNPQVSVILTDVRSYKVSVLGEVVKPGRFELKSYTTILDVLAQAGGFTQFAGRGSIVVLRPNGGTMKRIPFNYNKVVSSSVEGENIYLQPGDIVLVP